MQQEILPILSGIIIFGLSHGINPSHGWTIAVLYALQSKRSLFSSILSSGILASAHFLSSIVVVLAFIVFSTYIYIPQNYLNYAAAIALGILAFMFCREKPNDLVRVNMVICINFQRRLSMIIFIGINMKDFIDIFTNIK